MEGGGAVLKVIAAGVLGCLETWTITESLSF